MKVYHCTCALLCVRGNSTWHWAWYACNVVYKLWHMHTYSHSAYPNAPIYLHASAAKHIIMTRDALWRVHWACAPLLRSRDTH